MCGQASSKNKRRILLIDSGRYLKLKKRIFDEAKTPSVAIGYKRWALATDCILKGHWRPSNEDKDFDHLRIAKN